MPSFFLSQICNTSLTNLQEKRMECAMHNVQCTMLNAQCSMLNVCCTPHIVIASLRQQAWQSVRIDEGHFSKFREKGSPVQGELARRSRD